MRKILNIMCMFLFCHSWNAQRMLPGQKGIELSTGVYGTAVPGNYSMGAGLIIHCGKGHYRLYRVEYGRKTTDYRKATIVAETYTAQMGYSFNLISDRRKNMMLNASLGGLGGFENVNQGDSYLYDGAKLLEASSFVYGLSGGLGIETYISDRWVVMASGRIQLLWNSSAELFRPSVGMGLRFNL